MNIAIFGGSFDPPHLGHDDIVKTATTTLDIDKLIIIPTFLNPFKTNFNATPNLRLKWCRTLWADLPKVVVSDFEINMQKSVKSIQSVRYFKELYKPDKIYLIIGADQLENLDKWYQIDELKKLVKFVVAKRDDIIIDENLQKLEINVRISSSHMRENFDFSQVPIQIRDEVEKIYKENNAKQD